MLYPSLPAGEPRSTTVGHHPLHNGFTTTDLPTASWHSFLASKRYHHSGTAALFLCHHLIPLALRYNHEASRPFIKSLLTINSARLSQNCFHSKKERAKPSPTIYNSLSSSFSFHSLPPLPFSISYPITSTYFPTHLTPSPTPSYFHLARPWCASCSIYQRLRVCGKKIRRQP